MSFRFILFALPLLFVAACVAPPAQVPYLRDIIPLQTLVAGKPDSLLLSDLFYAETYAAEFEPNPYINIQYDSTSRVIVLLARPDYEGLTLLSFRHGSAVYKIPVQTRRVALQTFSVKPNGAAKTVSVMGSFNNWNRSSSPMTPTNDGRYEISVPLDVGRYEYKFVVDGKEMIDPSNPDKVPNGFGDFNSVLVVQPRLRETAFLHIDGCKFRSGETEIEFVYERDKQTKRLTSSNIVALLDNQSIPDQQLKLIDNRVVVRLKADNLVGEKTMRIAVTQDGLTTPMQTVHLSGGRPLGSVQSQNAQRPVGATPTGVITPPVFNWHDAVMYSLMIDRFHNGDTTNDKPVVQDLLMKPANYYGGDLAGVIKKIEEGYFDSLGVNVLWLSPVNQNPDKAYREYPPPHRYYTGYHGYWSVDPEKVDARFGDMPLLKQLVAKAHLRNIKVILDFVAHHVHEEHPFFKAHPNWFGTYHLPDGRKNLRLWDDYRLTTWFEPYLPTFDYTNADALDTMTQNALWWLKQTGADGFRHDAVKHVPNLFWQTLTRKLKRTIAYPQKKPIYQIGETFGSYDLVKSYVNNGQLNAQFNFNLFYTARRVFLSDAHFSELSAELQKTFDTYGMSNLMGNIMDSHDQARYIAFADGDIGLDEKNAQELAWTKPPTVDDDKSYAKATLYLAYLLTIPGVPTLYYGDEFGMTGLVDPDNRRPMRFGKDLSPQEQTMLTGVVQLIKLRRTSSALRYGDFRTLFANETCFAYLRSDPNERVLIALNKSNAPQTISVDFPKFYQAKTAKNLLTSQTAMLSDDKLSLVIPATGFVVLKIE